MILELIFKKINDFVERRIVEIKDIKIYKDKIKFLSFSEDINYNLSWQTVELKFVDRIFLRDKNNNIIYLYYEEMVDNEKK